MEPLVCVDPKQRVWILYEIGKIQWLNSWIKKYVKGFMFGVSLA